MFSPTFVALSIAVLLLPLAVTFGCGRAGPLPEVKTAPKKESKLQPTPHEHPANRLAKETSLYLLMHAHNPVDWYPWGEEAFAKAKAEGKLIFLSIGYSSCYWCHVMERETFMDQEVADLLNEHFVCIKVDREERPDIDEIYMTALQIYFHLIRSPRGGGWPLTMFLTPDARPVMGGTYFPPRDKNGLPGLMTVLGRVQEAWEENPARLKENAELLSEFAKQQLQQQASGEKVALEPGLTDGVAIALAEQFDPRFGGFGYSEMNPQLPKFPQPSNLEFLIHRAREQGDEQARSMLLTTLEKMAAGGIRDHLGGGFHRYSTDRFWAIPHFEKMLYDNGQLASVYAKAYQFGGHEDFRRIVDEILQFVLREMTGPEGGFYSAIDAETEAEEGRFYVWRRDELTDLLDADEFQLLAEVYGIGEKGNFEGFYTLLLPQPILHTAEARETSEQQLREELAPVLEKLFAARSLRERPLTDTKVLTAWNGLMIRGFADAGRLLERPEYIEAAERTARFILDNLSTPEGRLLRTYGDGRAKLNAYLDDYAFLADGLIALHRATGRPGWLREADRLTTLQIELFWDEQGGGFFFTSSDHESLLARSKDPTDSALPSGNAVAAGNLVYLAEHLDNPDYLDRAKQTVEAFGPLLKSSPAGMPRMAIALAELLETRKHNP